MAPWATILGEQRVVERGHREPLGDAGLDAQIVPRHRPHHAGERAGLGGEALGRILGVDARLDGVALARGLEHGAREPLAGGDADLLLDQIDPGAHLGDAVLDLEPGVHLEEPQLAVGAGHELDRAGAHVADAADDAQGRREQLLPAGLAGGAGEEGRGRGRLFDDLLVAALHAALALAERHVAAPAVAEHLHLDVLGGADVALQVHARIGERRSPPIAAGRDRARELGRIVDDGHADAAAAARRLDQERVADALGLGGDRRHIGRVDGPVGARRRRHAGRARHLPRLDLVAEGVEHRGRRPDEGDARLGHAPREARVLAEQAVARVDALGARLEGRGDDGLGVEVALFHRRRPQADRLVGELDVRRPGVGVGVDGDRPDAEALAGAEDAAGDLAAVGDEDFVSTAESYGPRREPSRGG